MFVPRLRCLAAAGFAAALVLAAAPPAPVAAGEQDAGSGQSSQSQAAQYTDSKLRSFAVAALDVREVIADWGPKMEEAKDKAEAEKLRRQANGELVAAIENVEGISVGEYQQIIQDVRADKKLYERLRGIVTEVEQDRQ